MKTLAIYGIIVASALGVGVGGGTLIKREFSEPERDYSGFDVSIYDIDEQALIEKAENFATPTMAYNAMTPVDLVNYTFAKYKRYENSYSYGVGLAKTIIDQTIRNAAVKNGNRYFEESVSKSSMVAVANRAIQNGEGGDVDLYTAPENGNSVFIDAPVCAYYDTPAHLTADEYSAMYGRTPFDMFNYIIHKDSVVSSEKKVLDNGDYQFLLVTNPDIATYNYQFQMQTISHLNKKPTFTRSELTIVTDSNLVLKNLITDETYKAVMGVEATINSHIEYTYFANCFYKIPELNENFDYVRLRGE